MLHVTTECLHPKDGDVGVFSTRSRGNRRGAWQCCIITRHTQHTSSHFKHSTTWAIRVKKLSCYDPHKQSELDFWWSSVAAHFCHIDSWTTWGRGWMTKASGVGERRKGRGELRRDCHHRVAALFVPTRMQQWYIEIWYITMIYMGEGAGGGPFAGKITWCPWGAPEYVLKQEDSSELTLAFVIMTIIANNDKM